MANQVCYLNVPIVHITLCSLIPLFKCKEIITKADEFKKLDDDIFKSIHHPSSLHGWEELLENIDFYNKNLLLKIEELGNSTHENYVLEAEKIWNNDMPKFITQDLDESMYSIVISITKEQLKRFHEMQKTGEDLWNKFGEIIATKKQHMKKRL